jgi:hypothetical protein
MWNKLSILLVFCFIQSPTAWTQKVYINASGKGYENAEFRIYSLSDPITLQLIPVLKAKADDNGILTVSINCNEPEQLIIKTGIYCLSLFVEQDKTYQISLPPAEIKTTDDELNPFFQESSIIPKIINDTACLNNLISDFEDQFNSVYDTVSARIVYNKRTNEIPLLINNLNKSVLADTSVFFSDYVKYKISLLELMTFNPFEDKVKATLYVNNKVNLSNPAYTELIGQVFNGYLKTLMMGAMGTEIIDAINKGSFFQLKSVVKKDNKISNDQLLEYVLLLNLYEELYSGIFNKNDILQLIENQEYTTTYQSLQTIAAIVFEKGGRLMPGTVPPVFDLINQLGDTVSISDFKGKFILLSFARSDSYSCLLEFNTVKIWQNKYEKDLKLLIILTDRDFSKGFVKLKKAGYNWEFLDGSDNEHLLFAYDIKIYPSFILLDREGKIIMAPSLLPSEQLETMISERIQRDSFRSGLVKQ